METSAKQLLKTARILINTKILNSKHFSMIRAGLQYDGNLYVNQVEFIDKLSGF